LWCQPGRRERPGYSVPVQPLCHICIYIVLLPLFTLLLCARRGVVRPFRETCEDRQDAAVNTKNFQRVPHRRKSCPRCRPEQREQMDTYKPPTPYTVAVYKIFTRKVCAGRRLLKPSSQPRLYEPSYKRLYGILFFWW
jgi:hypothetical protein